MTRWCLLHVHALLTSSAEGATAYVEADMRDTEAVLEGAAKTLDLSEPVALVISDVLGHIVDWDDALSLVRRLVARLPSGSYLVPVPLHRSDEAPPGGPGRVQQQRGDPVHLPRAGDHDRVLRRAGDGGAGDGVLAELAARREHRHHHRPGRVGSRRPHSLILPSTRHRRAAHPDRRCAARVRTPRGRQSARTHPTGPDAAGPGDSRTVREAMADRLLRAATRSGAQLVSEAAVLVQGAAVLADPIAGAVYSTPATAAADGVHAAAHPQDHPHHVQRPAAGAVLVLHPAPTMTAEHVGLVATTTAALLEVRGQRAAELRAEQMRLHSTLLRLLLAGHTTSVTDTVRATGSRMSRSTGSPAPTSPPPTRSSGGPSARPWPGTAAPAP